MKKLILFCVAVLSAPSLYAAIGYSLDESGVKIVGESFGSFTLQYPVLVVDGQGSSVKPAVAVRKKADKPSAKPAAAIEATLKYTNGLEVEVAVRTDDRTVSYSFPDIPSGSQYLNFELDLPISSVLGGKASFDKVTKVLPDHLDQTMVWSGTCQNFKVLNGAGHGFSIKAIPNFMSLQDNRAFGGELYVYEYHYYIQADPGQHQIILSIDEAK